MSHMGACLLPFIGFMPGCYLIKVDRTAVDDDVTDGIKADGGERDPLPSIGVVPALFCLLSIAGVGCKINNPVLPFGKTGLLIRSIVMRGCSCDAGRIRQQRMSYFVALRDAPLCWRCARSSRLLLYSCICPGFSLFATAGGSSNRSGMVSAWSMSRVLSGVFIRTISS